jgi:uncharacterized Zn finger protein
VTVCSIAPATPIEHAALDAILSHLERRYGLDPRIDRAYRIVMSGRVELAPDGPTTGLVHGDSGNSYWATVDGFCECPDHANGHICKHALAVMIAAQLRAVSKAKEAQQDDGTDLLAYYQNPCQEQQARGRLLIANGVRPVDNPTWRDADEQIQALRRQLPTLVVR